MGESGGPRAGAVLTDYQTNFRSGCATVLPNHTGGDHEQMDRAFCRRAAGLRLQCRGC